MPKRRMETFELLAGIGWVYTVGISQVGHEPFERQDTIQVCHPEQSRQLVRIEAETAHSGIDLDVNGIGSRSRWNLSGEDAGHFQVMDHRGETVGHQGWNLGGQESPEHDERMVDAGFTQLNSFFDGRHTEAAYARLRERPRHGGGSMAVRVGLDDGQNVGWSEEAPSGLIEVMDQAVEIDAREGGWAGR